MKKAPRQNGHTIKLTLNSNCFKLDRIGKLQTRASLQNEATKVTEAKISYSGKTKKAADKTATASSTKKIN